jgi:hypothetical protein
MWNVKPIFLLGLSRSGTNLLMNLLRSHPDFCCPRGEIHEVFLGKNSDSSSQKLWKRVKSLPIFWAEGYNVFQGNDWTPRPQFRQVSKLALDHRLYSERYLADSESQNLYRKTGQPYTISELRNARLVCKCLDAQTYLTPALRDTFPDSQFVALVRHPLAICEGRSRRGYLSPLDFAPRCREVYDWLLQLNSQLTNFKILKYEDLTVKPTSVLATLFDFLQVSGSEIDEFRMESKESRHGTLSEKEVVRYPAPQLASHFRADMNSTQIERLSKREKGQITKICSDVMERLGYQI